MRLLTDEQITNYRDKESGALTLPPQESKRIPADQLAARRLAIRHACNLEIHRAFVIAGVREGFSLQSKGTQLPQREAAVMQTLSKELRDLGFVSLPVATRTPKSKPANGTGSSTRWTLEERAKTFRDWCAGNRLEKFAALPPRSYRCSRSKMCRFDLF